MVQYVIEKGGGENWYSDVIHSTNLIWTDYGILWSLHVTQYNKN